MKLPEAVTQPKYRSSAKAEARKRSRDDVINKSSTSSDPHQRRLTPDSGVDVTDIKSSGHFDEHAFQHTFRGFPSPVHNPSSLSIDPNSSANRSCSSNESLTFSGCLLSGPTTDGHFRATGKSTLIHNGHCTVTTRDALNGDETVVIEENGIITAKTHNGRPCVTSV